MRATRYLASNRFRSKPWTILEILSCHHSLSQSQNESHTLTKDYPHRLGRVREPIILLLTQMGNFDPVNVALPSTVYPGVLRRPQYFESHNQFCVFFIHKVVVGCSTLNNTTINQ